MPTKNGTSKPKMTKQILEKSYWENIRKELKESYDINDNWLEVISRFKERIENYYFDPIERIKDPNELKGEGFSILTIQCAVIEMLAAFRLGKIYNYKKPRNGGLKFEYKQAHECFIKFLHTAPIFENHFYRIYNNNRRRKNIPFDAYEFYNKVRCGLMHEGRTKGDWLVNAKKDFRYDGTETQFLGKNNKTKKISVDRTILNNVLRIYFNDYLNELRSPNVDGKKLRMFFGRKLDNLYDLPRDTKYDWWRIRPVNL